MSQPNFTQTQTQGVVRGRKIVVKKLHANDLGFKGKTAQIQIDSVDQQPIDPSARNSTSSFTTDTH